MPKQKDYSGGNRREDRLRRWIAMLPSEGIDVLRLEVRRAGVYEALTFATAVDVESRAGDVAEAFSVALQGEADALGTPVRARVAAYSLGDDKERASTEVRANPGEDADPLPDGQLDPSVEGQIGQLQTFCQALMRLNIESQMASVKANREAMTTLVSVLERMDSRHAREADAVDAMRTAISEAEQDGAEWAGPAMAVLERVLPTAQAALAVWAQRKAPAPKTPDPGPVVDGEHEP